MVKITEIVAGATVSPADANFSAVRFIPPGERTKDGQGQTCLVKAVVIPGKGELRINMLGCEMVGVRESRKNAPTLLAKAPKQALALLMQLDEHVLQVAKANIDTWFLHAMHGDLVEEYYRGATDTHIKHGVMARFVIEGALDTDVDLATSGNLVDLQLRFVGVKFRRQHFTPVWKLIAATPSSPQASACAFVSEDEEEEEVGPSHEEYSEMRQALMARLISLESEQESRVDHVRAMISALDASPCYDLHTLDETTSRLDDMLEQWKEDCYAAFFSRQ
jgi:hypothetical protein